MLRRRRAAASEPLAEHPEERSIRDALAGLGDTTVREVMTPRVDVVALRAPVRPDDVARAVKESGHSRFPVYEGDDLDDLAGVLFVKDLFRSGGGGAGGGAAWAGGSVRLRKPFVVPETAPVLSVLSQMRVGRNAFAVVIDEHGGVEGVLTVKDLVSELVGDLPDEFDQPAEEDVVRVDASRWLVDGACPVDDLGAALGPLGLEVPDGDYVTVGGYLFDRFGRIPGEGDILVLDGWEWRVSEMDRRRIAKVVLRAPADAASDTMSPGADGTPRSPGATSSNGK
jgi:CBS domain containing-hemolysin-like protein